MLRQHFGRAPLQGYPALLRCQYVPDQRVDGEDVAGSLRVDMYGEWNPSRAGTVPALIVKKGDLGTVALGIGDRHMSPGMTNLKGERYYTLGYAGSLLLFCVSRAPAQAELIALSAAEYLQQFSDQIKSRACLTSYRVQQIKAVKPLQEHPTYLASVVVIEYGFFESWSVTPAAPVLSRVETQIASQ